MRSSKWIVMLGLGIGCESRDREQREADLSLASEAEHAALRPSLDSIIAPRLRRGFAPAVALIFRGKRYAYFYGDATTGGEPQDEQSFFELGSIGKTFVGLVLARMVIAGAVALDDPVARHLPAGASVPGGGTSRPITLLDLATHRSGLPFSLPAASAVAGDAAERRFFEALAATKLESAPGERFSYSNVGAALLAYALAAAQGKAWDDVAKSDVLLPLGMTDTHATLTADEARRWVQSFDYDGRATRPTEDYRREPEGPSGGHFTSLRDVTRYMAHGLAHEPSRVFTQRVHAAVEGKVGIGLFWFLDLDARGEVISVSHDGEWNGFQNHLRIAPAARIGVAVLGNSAAPDAAGSVWRMAEAIEAALRALP